MLESKKLVCVFLRGLLASEPLVMGESAFDCVKIGVLCCAVYLSHFGAEGTVVLLEDRELHDVARIYRHDEALDDLNLWVSD